MAHTKPSGRVLYEQVLACLAFITSFPMSADSFFLVHAGI
ncbi:hypothetical protein YSA_07464 [Pseudomonas putida ND6]|uniref:Uncharacterized protein n=1 Tax=Pseudomonas putida ND6 TaxID=231023 RepID=I3UZ79_PSEPU|nr:hypothetical protein YSA_07464 [Pseudomonas putida ND6]